MLSTTRSLPGDGRTMPDRPGGPMTRAAGLRMAAGGGRDPLDSWEEHADDTLRTDATEQGTHEEGPGGGEQEGARPARTEAPVEEEGRDAGGGFLIAVAAGRRTHDA